MLKKVYKNYDLEYSKPITDNKMDNGFKTVITDIAKIEETNLRLRHSATKLEKLFKTKNWMRK